jgi:hypothetical protein
MIVAPVARYSPRPGSPERSAKDTEALVIFAVDLVGNPERHLLFGKSSVEGCEATTVQPAGRSEAVKSREVTTF